MHDAARVYRSDFFPVSRPVKRAPRMAARHHAPTPIHTQSWRRPRSQIHTPNTTQGLGWMLTATLWAELKVKWPRGYWDDWMRLNVTRKGRQCLRCAIFRVNLLRTRALAGLSFSSLHGALVSCARAGRDSRTRLQRALSTAQRGGWAPAPRRKQCVSAEATPDPSRLLAKTGRRCAERTTSGKGGLPTDSISPRRGTVLCVVLRGCFCPTGCPLTNLPITLTHPHPHPPPVPLCPQYLADIVLNDVSVDWPRQDLGYLAEDR